MPATVAAIETYVKGKKYRKAAEQNAYNYEQFKPHLVPSTKKKHFHELFCNLTLRHISYTPQAVERHVTGRKYKNALKRWQLCKETGEKFVPRTGRRKKQTVPAGDSDGDGFVFGEDIDGSSDGAEGEDDMSDLYPDEFFSKAEDSGNEEESGIEKDSSVVIDEKSKKLPKAKAVNIVNKDDSDSDYDMNVLEGIENKNPEEESDSEEDSDDSQQEIKPEPKKSNPTKRKGSKEGATPPTKKKKS